MNHFEPEDRKPHPRERATLFSKIFFFYSLTIFKREFKRLLGARDLYKPPSNYNSEKLVDNLERTWKEMLNKTKNRSMFLLLWKCYGLYYLALGIIKFIVELTLFLLQPYVTGKVVAYFSLSQNEMSRKEAYVYAALLVGLNIFSSIFNNNNALWLQGLGIKIRTAVTTFIYKKILELNQENDVDIGKALTHITKDVYALETFAQVGNEIWILFLKSFLIIMIFYIRMGSSYLLGFLIILIFIPIQVFGIKLIIKNKKILCQKADTRYQIIQDVLSTIRTVKMYVWEKIFEAKVSIVRKKEIEATERIFLFKFIFSHIGFITINTASIVTYLIYKNSGSIVTPETIFYIYSTFTYLNVDFSMKLTKDLYGVAEFCTCVKRIETFMNLKSSKNFEVRRNLKKSVFIGINKDILTINKKIILEKIYLGFEPGLTVLTGPVNSGKTSLLKVILNEGYLGTGDVVANGTISYVSQKPWLFPSTIKQNILFGEKYKEQRYRQVLKICCLVYDLETLDDGDLTIVEDHGLNLSKGQQIRINLARAVYRDRDIYLLDNCLVNLDENVTSFIFEECVKKFLKDKLVVLVTQNPKHMSEANKIVNLGDGGLKHLENPVETVIEDHLKQRETVKTNDDNKNFFEENSKMLEENSTKREIYKEDQSSSTVKLEIYNKYTKYGGGYIMLFIVVVIYICVQLSTLYAHKIFSKWADLAEKFSKNSFDLTLNNTISENDVGIKASTTFWLYVGTTVGSDFLGPVSAICLYIFAKKVGIRLHRQMLSKILNAPLTFFDNHFAGNILNRFSKDFIIIDETIPYTLHDVLWSTIYTLGVFVLVTQVDVVFGLCTAGIIVVDVVLQKYYVQTARNLKRLEAACRSPVVGYTGNTIEGLTTIRSHKMENILVNEFNQHQNTYTSAAYTFYCCKFAFCFAIDFLNSIIVAIVVITCLILKEKLQGGTVGLVITLVIKLRQSLQRAMTSCADLESYMTSVERVVEYTKTKQENKQGLVLENWPKQGEIIFKNVHMTYPQCNHACLKDLNLVIEPKDKIAIVGRTGSGKTSLISTLFRLRDFQGQIIIDGEDIKTMSLDFFRSRISIISQDALIFTGSIRDNIDPNKNLSDEEIWKIIETVNLKKLIPSLDFPILDNDTGFSAGQKQLICLARAVAKKNKILVLDEATADLDDESDMVIQDIIKNKFADSTVVIIAHKAQSMLNCNKVVVVSNGEIVECVTLKKDL